MLGVVIIWVVAGLSALVDNVPVTIAMILLLQGLAAKGVPCGGLSCLEQALVATPPVLVREQIL